MLPGSVKGVITIGAEARRRSDGWVLFFSLGHGNGILVDIETDVEGVLVSSSTMRFWSHKTNPRWSRGQPLTAEVVMSRPLSATMASNRTYLY